MGIPAVMVLVMSDEEKRRVCVFHMQYIQYSVCVSACVWGGGRRVWVGIPAVMVLVMSDEEKRRVCVFHMQYIQYSVCV